MGIAEDLNSLINGTQEYKVGDVPAPILPEGTSDTSFVPPRPTGAPENVPALNQPTGSTSGGDELLNSLNSAMGSPTPTRSLTAGSAQPVQPKPEAESNFIGRHIKAGFRSVPEFFQTAGGLVNKALGLPEDWKAVEGKGFVQSASDILAPSPKDVEATAKESGFLTKVAAGALETPGQLAKYAMLATAASGAIATGLAPIIGASAAIPAAAAISGPASFALASGVDASPQGWTKALESAGMGAVVGVILHYLGPAAKPLKDEAGKIIGTEITREGLALPAKALVTGALFGGQTLAEGGTIDDAAPSMVLGMALGALSGGKSKIEKGGRLLSKTEQDRRIGVARDEATAIDQALSAKRGMFDTPEMVKARQEQVLEHWGDTDQPSKPQTVHPLDDVLSTFAVNNMLEIDKVSMKGGGLTTLSINGNDFQGVIGPDGRFTTVKIVDQKTQKELPFPKEGVDSKWIKDNLGLEPPTKSVNLLAEKYEAMEPPADQGHLFDAKDPRITQLPADTVDTGPIKHDLLAEPTPKKLTDVISDKFTAPAKPSIPVPEPPNPTAADAELQAGRVLMRSQETPGTGTLDVAGVKQTIDRLSPLAERAGVSIEQMTSEEARKLGAKRTDVSFLTQPDADGKRRLVIVSDRARNPADVETSIWHEFTHKGVSDLLPTDKYNQFMFRLYDSIGETGMADIIRDYPQYDKNTPQGRVNLASEKLMRLGETNPTSPIWNQFIQWFRQMMRDIGFETIFGIHDLKTVTDAEIRSVIVRSRAQFEKQAAAGQFAGDAMARSRGLAPVWRSTLLNEGFPLFRKKTALTHYGTPGLTELDPNKYGTGKPDEGSKRANTYPEYWVNRISAYVGEHKPEMGLGSQAYDVQGNPKLLQHGDKDSFQLWSKAGAQIAKAGESGLNAQFTLYEKLAKKAGYDGIAGLGDKKNQAILFNRVPVKAIDNGQQFRARSEETVQRKDLEDRLAPVKEQFQALVKAGNGIQRLVAPTSRGPNAYKAGADVSEITSQKVRAFDIFIEQTNEAKKNFSRMTPEQQFDFTQRIATGMKQPTKELQDVASMWKDISLALANRVNELVPGAVTIRKNYWPGVYKEKTSIAQAGSVRPIEPTGFTKAKEFQTPLEARNAGYEPIDPNPVVQMAAKVAEMQKFILIHEALQRGVTWGNVMEVPAGASKPEGWHYLPEPYGVTKNGRYAVDDESFPVYRNYFSRPLSTNEYFGPWYRGYMKVASVMNQFQLFGAFHAGFVFSEAIIGKGAIAFKQAFQVMQGKESAGNWFKTMAEVPVAGITKAIEGGKIYKEWSNPGSQGPEVAQMVKDIVLGGGRRNMDQLFRTDQLEKFNKAVQDKNYVMAALRSPFAAMDLAMKPIMTWYVPRLKFGAFTELAQEFRKRNPTATPDQLQAGMRQIWNRIDSRLGQVVYDRMFMNNATKNVIQALVRAPGWTGGTILEIGGAPLDAARFVTEWAKTGKMPTEMPDRVAYVLSLAMTVAIGNGALTYLLTGDKPEGMDFVAFRTGVKDANGDPERGMLPTYGKDVYALQASPVSTLMHKINPLLSTVATLLKNQDYYGTKVITDDATKGQKLGEIGQYLAKAYLPFFVTGIKRNAEEGVGVLRTVGPVVGVMPAPSYFNQTPAERLARELSASYMSKGGVEKSRFEAHQLINHYAKQYGIAQRDGKPTDQVMMEMSKDLADGKITKQDLLRFKNKISKDPLVVIANKMSMRDTIHIWDVANTEEKQQLAGIMFKKYRNMPQSEEKVALTGKIQKISEELSTLYKG